MQNGISFREGDFAVFHKVTHTVIVKLSAMNVELFKGIVLFSGPPEIPLIRLEFFEVEKKPEGQWRLGEVKILRKIGVTTLPGQQGVVTLGKDLAIEVEAHCDGADRQLIDTRLILSELGAAIRVNGRIVYLIEASCFFDRLWL